MRRLLRLLLACAVGAAGGAVPATVLTAGPAAAHTCAVAAEIPVGEPTSVNVGVTVEAVAVPAIDITIPPELRLESVEPSPEWSLAVDGQQIRATGPAVPANSCKFFRVRITATKKGAYGISVVQRDANGNVVAESKPVPGQPVERFLVQAVYAGVKIPSGGGGSELPITLIAGIGLLVLAGMILAGVTVRNRRADAREDELQDRLDVFREQARVRRS